MKNNIKTYNCSRCNKIISNQLNVYKSINGNNLCYQCKKSEDPNWNIVVCSNCGKSINIKSSHKSSKGDILCNDCIKVDNPKLGIKICSNCGKSISNNFNIYKSISGNILCHDCKLIEDPHFDKKICKICNKESKKLYKSLNGNYICYDCKIKEDPLFRKCICSKCNKIIPKNHSYKTDEGIICYDCNKLYNSNIIRYICSKCGNSITDNLHKYKSSDGNILCYQCKKSEDPNWNIVVCSNCGKSISRIGSYRSITNGNIICYHCRSTEDPNFRIDSHDYRNSPERINLLKDKYQLHNYIIIDTYLHNNETIFKFKCKICNHEFEKSIKELGLGNGYYFSCPNSKCDRHSHSNQELELRDYIRSILNDDSITSNRNLIKNNSNRYCEIDIYIPKYKLGIEYDGLYWHDDINNSYKYSKCKELGIRLIQITEYEWIYKRQLVESYLKSIFNIFEYTINSDECIVKEITENTYKDFIESNHIKGYITADIKLGLFYNDKLIQIESFNRSEDDQWELIRASTITGLNVMDGYSKLINYFINKFNPKSIILKCDKSKYSEDSFLPSKFKMIYDLPSDYEYYEDRKIFNYGYYILSWNLTED